MTNASPETVLHVANMPAKDALFMRPIVALFTDPQNAEKLQDLQAGLVAIRYGDDGSAHILAAEAMTPAAQRN